MAIPYPQDGDCNPYYLTYIRRMDPATEVLGALEATGRESAELFGGLTEAQAGHRYAPGKWSLREVAGHLADAERVFALRGLWVARGDPAPQPGFDENAWAAASNADQRPMAMLVRELAAVRAASLSLFEGMAEADWARTGTMSGYPVTLRALPWIIVGHERHHLGVIRDRYL